MNNKAYRLSRYENDDEFREKTKSASTKWRLKNPNYLKLYYKNNKEKFSKKDSNTRKPLTNKKTGKKYDLLLKLAKSKGFQNVAQLLKNY